MSAQLRPRWALRPMIPEDVAAVARIEAAAYPYPWSAGIFSDCLRVGYHAWVAENAQGRVVGHALMATAVGEAHVLNVCVHPDHQGAGLGRAFMQCLIELARAEGVVNMFLEVRPSNEAALRLYRSLGFRRAGLRPNYYPAADGREDAMVLVCEL